MKTKRSKAIGIVPPFGFLLQEPKEQGALIAEAMLARRDPDILLAIGRAMNAPATLEGFGFLEAIEARLIGARVS